MAVAVCEVQRGGAMEGRLAIKADAAPCAIVERGAHVFALGAAAAPRSRCFRILGRENARNQLRYEISGVG